MNATEQARKILEALTCDRRSCDCHAAVRRGQGKTHCPTHDDPGPSLNVSVRDGKVLVNCFGGCDQADVLDALAERGLWARSTDEQGSTIERRWVIRRADGTPVATHIRREFANAPKRFVWDGGLAGVPVADLPLYAVERLNGASAVIVTEGEKCADALLDLELPAVATVTGAQATPSENSLRDLLAVATVYLWPDNDDAGQQHMSRIAARLTALGHPDVKIIEWSDAKAKDDAYDFIALGSTADHVRRLARKARIWEPEIVSNAIEIGVPSETKLVWHTAREIGEQTPEEVEWILRPWVAIGSICEVDAKLKTGKSTWLSYGLRQALDGLPFMGEPTTRTPVVYLTEQPPRSFQQVLRRADLLERDDLHVLYWHDAVGVDWLKIATEAIRKCLTVEAKLLVVDTLPQFAGLRGEAENNSGAALEAMEPLQAAAAEHDLAIVIVRHERKSGGEVGDSARGSSAFGGAVDVVLAIRRAEGNTRPTVRVIHALSRFDETPDVLVVELTEQGYVALGEETAVAATEARTAILEHAPRTEQHAITKAELLDRLDGVKSTTAQTALDKLLDDGLIRRTGEGKRGSPYRYWRPLNDDQQFLSDSLVLGVPSETNESDESSRVSGRQILSDGTPVEPSETNESDETSRVLGRQIVSDGTPNTRESERNESTVKRSCVECGMSFEPKHLDALGRCFGCTSGDEPFNKLPEQEDADD